MLAIYEGAHTGTETSQAAPVGSAGADTRLPGTLRSGSVAATQYHNAYTGALAPTSGNTFFYEFLSDGTYHLNGLMQITTYGCTSSIWRDNSGAYRVERNRLYIQPTQGVVRSHVCGGQEVTKEDQRELSVHTFRLEPSSQGESLVIGPVDGSARPDYFRRQK